MIAPCAAVYVRHSEIPHKAKILINYRKCGKLQEGQYYDHGRGVLIRYGQDGESVIVTHSDTPHLVMLVDLKHKILRKCVVQNLGPALKEVVSEWSVDR